MSPGSIYYLPPLASLPASQKSRLSSIHEGVFGHPVVVTSIDPWRSEANILIMTTFGGKPLEQKPRKYQERWVPVFPNEPHPVNGSILYLDTDWGMPKPGYVDTKQVLTVPACILRPLFDQNTKRHFRFRASSFAELQLLCPSRGSSPMRSSRSSSSSSFSSSSSSSSIASNPFSTPTRKSIRYTQMELLSLRTTSSLTPEIISRLQTADFDLLHSAHKCPSVAPLPRPTTLPDLAPISRARPAWRPSSKSTPPVSSPHRQRYVDKCELDLYFPTAPPPAPVGYGAMIRSSFDDGDHYHDYYHHHHYHDCQQRYVDADELDLVFRSTPPVALCYGMGYGVSFSDAVVC
ncbi:MAG: hypothetical protein Q9186_003765 [Xanthomendoza sp. 1 TL-2023]